MTAKIFIDGEHGTTGLQIRSRLESRSDITLLGLAHEDRHDIDRRRGLLNAADLVVLCLPDDAAREAVTMIENPAVRVIDASTAHRVAESWIYGLPEYDAGQRVRIAEATRVSNPGCYALAAIAILHPLVRADLLPADWPVVINGVSGYSGGGKALIAEFENPASETFTETAFRLYALGLEHKHVPEIQLHSGLAARPLFVPSVGRYYKGMIVQVPLQLGALPGRPTPEDVYRILARHYNGEAFITVADAGDLPASGLLDPENLNNTNELRLHVFGNDDKEQAVVAGLLDNLGKGASGQAVQNMNIMLGLPEEAGLAVGPQTRCGVETAALRAGTG